MSGADLNHDSPAEIRATLASLGMALKKRWGQNFLVNRGAREKLVALLELEAGMRVWEIGPGLGAMTEMILAHSGLASLTVFEIDAAVVAYLRSRHGSRPGFRVVAGDAAATLEEEAARAGLPDRLLGNLPYASASAIIARLVESALLPPRAVLTVQKELAERMLSRPGQASYSSFSVLCRSACFIRRQGDLRPGSFYPAPQVISTIVTLEPREPAEAPADWPLFRALVRGLFASRRKTLRASIAAGRVPPGCTREHVLAACAASGVDPRARPEECDVAEWVRLANALSRELGAPPAAAAAAAAAPRSRSTGAATAAPAP